MFELGQVLKHVQSRRSRGRYGIGTAAQYLAELQNCIDGEGACPTKLFGLADSTEWQRRMKEAESRFTYCDEPMVVKRAGGKTADKSTLLTFDCVLTCTRRDRDGDILESKGAEVDERMPLLWQHVANEPIGKLLHVSEQTDQFVSAKFAILDLKNHLAHDAATLVEAGALRISHGFLPQEYEPIPFDEAKGITDETDIAGWHVKRFEVMEGSVVSVPSNVGAIIVAWERNKLHHPAVKQYAKSLFDSRTKVFRGISFQKAEPKAMPAPKPTDTKAASPGTKSYGFPDFVEGSFEWIRAELQKTLLAQLITLGIVPADKASNVWAFTLAMFGDSALVTYCSRYGDWDDEPVYRLGWTMTDGRPSWTGAAAPVEIRVSAVQMQVGSRVKVKPGRDHDEMTMGKNGTIREVETPALGVKFDGMDMIHRWYIEDELELVKESEESEESGPPAVPTTAGMTRESVRKIVAEQLALLKETKAPLAGKVAPIAAHIKAGKVLSKANKAALTDAATLMKEVAERDDVPSAAKTLASKAYDLVKGVVDAAEPAEETDASKGAEPQTKSLLEQASDVLAEAGQSTPAEFERWHRLYRALGAVLVQKQTEHDDAELAAALAEL